MTPTRRYWLTAMLSTALLGGSWAAPLVAAAQAPVATPQVAPVQATDPVFTLADLLSIVGEQHPVARQAALQPERARQEVRQARGMFDPLASSKFYRKEFGGKDYWNIWDNTLRVPTWYGPDVRLGYERNVGPRISEQDATPGAGLTYVGLSVPLAQGLLMDERRAAVRSAQALVSLAEAERVAALNKLLLSAAKEYWDWTLAFERRQLLQNNLELADIRYRAVRERVRLGDLASIDSVEALTELQNRRAQLVQAEVEWQNATLVLSNFLWDEQLRPRELPTTVRPQPLPPATAWAATPSVPLEQLVEQARQQHPDLLKGRAKLEQLGVERRLYQNKLLPKLSVDYNLLLAGRPFNTDSGYNADPLYTNNYKLGVSFAQPLFLRQERGKLQVTQLKIRETNLGLEQASRDIATAVRATANDQRALTEQLRLQEQVVQNAQRLREGEQIRFENGESSVFLLNSREASLLSARIKLAELQAKYSQTLAGLRFAAGSAPIAE